jgi:hypothetical protein
MTSFVSKFECNLSINLIWLAFFKERITNQESFSSHNTIASITSHVLISETSCMEELRSVQVIIQVNCQFKSTKIMLLLVDRTIQVTISQVFKEIIGVACFSNSLKLFAKTSVIKNKG